MSTTWIVIVAVVGGVVLLGLVASVLFLPAARLRQTERRQAQARDKLAESQQKMAEAASAQAAVEERAARARRDRAEAELRVMESERERVDAQAESDRQRADALKLRESAARLDPNLAERAGGEDPGGVSEPSEDVEQSQVAPTSRRA